MSNTTVAGEFTESFQLEAAEFNREGKWGISPAESYRDELFGQSLTTDLASARNEYKTISHVVQRFCYFALKRTVDIAVSSVALIVLSPVFLAAAVATWTSDRGPIFFCQQRVGRNGRTFNCFKFRSMVVNAQAMQEQLAAASDHSDRRTFKMANDPRITAVGKFLRRFSIDELPQVLNVLLGQMSIVGPRPPLPKEVELYSASDRRRLAVKPGLTCIWQVSGRARLPFSKQVELDVDYIQRQSLLLDFGIILRTIPAVFSGDGAS